MARYHAKTGAVYMNTGSGSAASLTASASWTLNMATDKVEVTAFGDSNKAYVMGLPDISGDISGFWDDTSDTLYDASRSAGAVTMYLYPSSLVPTKYFYGTAFVDFSIDCAVGGPVAISGSFVGASTWGQY